MANLQRSEQLILVTGATGNQGGAIARELLKRGFPVRALTRDSKKPKAQALAELGAEVIQGDLDDHTSVEEALNGAYGVFAVQNFWETGAERETQQGILLADAAKAANVKHFVYSSVGSADRHTGVPHFDSKAQIEDHIHTIGVPYTVFRPVAFYYTWISPPVPEYAANGVYSLPLSSDTKVQLLCEDDYASFVAMALENPDQWVGRSLDIASTELTMPQVAEIFGQVLGHPVQYVQMTWDQFRQAGGEEYASMFEFFENVGYSADLNVMRQEHPSLTSLDQYLRQHGWGNVAATAS